MKLSFLIPPTPSFSRESEEELLHLKRSRLMREADKVLARQSTSSAIQDEAIVSDVRVDTFNQSEAEIEQFAMKQFAEGSKCRFRYFDGRWYNGYVISQNGGDSVKVSFLMPTTEKMLICKFFLQERCRFGSNCRLSHGLDIPTTSLKVYNPTVWHEGLVGSRIWATSSGHGGIWKEAELESWDDKLQQARIVFRDDGNSAELGAAFLGLSEYAELTEEENEDDTLSSESYDSSFDDDLSADEKTNRGLGFLQTTSSPGVQTETVIFAKWERHTRGIASKMMVNMGYREGMGLGASGQGIVDPISIKVLPPRQALDHALKIGAVEEGNEEAGRKKRSRGGKRKREKKYAAAARAAKAEEDARPDVFNFINNQLAGQSDVKNSLVIKQIEEGTSKKKEDRMYLVAYDEEVKELKVRVKKLEEMVRRNRREKVVYEAMSRKLDETRKALADAEAAQSNATKAVVSKEKEKKWLKF